MAAGQAEAQNHASAARDACLYAYDAHHAGALRFQDFPATVRKAERRSPRIVGHDARSFRTMILEGSAYGMNFAGHYTIVHWGCGSSCWDWAMVDRATGKVIFDDGLRDIATDHVADGYALRFRRNSNLLVLQGWPNEDENDEKRDGIAFLRWTGRTFVQIKFIPAPAACHG